MMADNDNEDCFKCDLNGVVLEYIFLKTPFVNVMV